MYELLVNDRKVATFSTKKAAWDYLDRKYANSGIQYEIKRIAERKQKRDVLAELNPDIWG